MWAAESKEGGDIARACVPACVCVYIYSEGVIYTYMGGGDEEGIYFHKQSCLSERKVGCVLERERKSMHTSIILCIQIELLLCVCVHVCTCVCVYVYACVCVIVYRYGFALHDQNINKLIAFSANRVISLFPCNVLHVTPASLSCSMDRDSTTGVHRDRQKYNTLACVCVFKSFIYIHVRDRKSSRLQTQGTLCITYSLLIHYLPLTLHYPFD